MIWADVIEQFIKLDRKKFCKIHPIFVKHEHRENIREILSKVESSHHFLFIRTAFGKMQFFVDVLNSIEGSYPNLVNKKRS